MSLKFKCPHCEKEIKGSESHLGASVSCPNCKEKFIASQYDGASRSHELPKPAEVHITKVRIPLADAIRLTVVFWLASVIIAAAVAIIMAVLGITFTVAA